MPMPSQTYTQFVTALRELNLPLLTAQQADALADTFTISDLRQLVTSARASEPGAFECLDNYVRSAQAFTELSKLGHRHLTLTHVITIVSNQGMNRLRATYDDARRGDSNAKAVIGQWIIDVINATGEVPPNQGDNAPIHPTPLPPPPPMASTPAQSSAPMPPRNIPVERSTINHGEGSPREVQARNQHPANNVRQFPASRQDDRLEYQNRRDRYSSHQSQQQSPDRSEVREVVARESRFDQVEAYGSDIALQFERCLTIDRSTYTINLKCARAKEGGKTRNGCDWKNAILLMLTPHEVQLVAAVMLGYLPKFRAAGHGQLNDKWFEVEETSEAYAGAIRFTVAQGKDNSRDMRKVNVTATDAGKASAIFLRAARDQLCLDGHLLLATIRRTADLYAKGQQARQSRDQSGGFRRQAQV